MQQLDYLNLVGLWKQLKDFGLNPVDWVGEPEKCQPSDVTISHRRDPWLRLRGRVSHDQGHLSWTRLEWIEESEK